MGKIGVRQYILLAILIGILGIVTVYVVQKTMLTEAAPGINKTINFQGKMTDDDGLNVADGSYEFVFSMYTAASGGSATWTETVNLDVVDGIFHHQLGSSTALPGSVDFDTDNIFLGITFNNDPEGEMSPRIQLTATPYAFNADQLDGLDAGDFVQLSPSGAQTGDIAITGDISADELTLATALEVSSGGTGATTFTSNGVLYGNDTGAVQATTAGTTGQCLVATTGSAPSWGSCVGSGVVGGSGTANRVAYWTGTGTIAADDDFQFDGTNVTLGNNLTVNGNTTLGNESGDSLTLNGTAVAIPNNLNFDSNTLFIDAANNKVAVGTTTTTNGVLSVSGTAPNVSIHGSGIYLSTTLSSTTNNQQGIRSVPWIAPGSASSRTYYGGVLGPVTDSTNLTNATLVGASGQPYYFGSGTVGQAEALTAYVQNDGSGTITNAIGLRVVSTLNSGGTVGTNYGIHVEPQTAGTSDYGVRIDAADTQTLWISGNANNTTAAAGIAFGSSRDTNLYRSAANMLKTDDSFIVQGGEIYVGQGDTNEGTINVYGGGTGNNEGGQINLFTAADFDSSFDHWGIDAYQDNLRFFNPTSGSALVVNSTLDVEMFGELYNYSGLIEIGHNTQSGSLMLYDGSSNTVTLTASGIGSSYTLKLPTGAGSTDQCLMTDSSDASQLVFADCGGSGSGVETVGTIDSQTKSSNGAVISGQSIYLQTADATNVGLVSTGTQTFAGNKTFNNNLLVNGNTTLGNASGDSLTIQGTNVSIPNNLNFDSNTLYIDAGSNRIGIGTASPSDTLHVQGHIRMSGMLRDAESAGNNFLNLNVDGESNASIAVNNVYLSGINNVGILIDSNDNHTVGTFTVGTNGTSVDSANYVELFRIQENGNVGIGTAVPRGNLDVSGTNAELHVGASQAGYLAVGAQGDYSSTWANKAAIALNTVVLQGTGASGLVVRNHTDTAYGGVDALHYRSRDNGSASSTTFGPASATSGLFFPSSGVSISTSSTERLTVLSGGNVGIGDSSPAALLTVGNGDLFQVNASGAIAAVTGITSSGAYTQTGSAQNTFTGNLRVTDGPWIGNNANNNIKFNGSNHHLNTGTIFSINVDTNNTGTGYFRVTSGANDGAGTELLRVDRSGLVGIGTVSPQHRLHVNGGSAFFETATNSTPLTIARQYKATNHEEIRVGVDDGKAQFHYINDENVSRIQFTLQNTDTESGGGANARTNTPLTLYSDQNGGKVGINTISPSEALEVVGNIVASGTLAVNGNTTLGDASGDSLTIQGTNVSIPNNLNFDSNTLFIDATNNRVGIGTASPGYTLDVLGGYINADRFYIGNSTAYLSRNGGKVSLSAGFNFAADAFYFDTSGTNLSRESGTGRILTSGALGVAGDVSQVSYIAAGNFGIGDTSPAALLTVGNGDPFQVDTNGLIQVTNHTSDIELDFVGEFGTNIYTQNSFFFRIDSDNDSTDTYNFLNGAGTTILQVTESATMLLGASSVAGTLQISDGSSHTVSIVVPSISSSYTLTLPTTDGNTDECLKTNGSGTLSWGSCGGGATAKRRVLTPEFQGATISADGSSNSGIMTSDYVSGLVSGQGYKHNYYQWSTSQSSAQDYDIIVTHQLPTTYSAMGAAATFRAWAYAQTTTGGAITWIMEDVDGTQCFSQNLTLSTNTWVESGPGSLGSCSFAANDIVVFKFKMTATSSTVNLRLGEFRFDVTE